MTSRLIYPEAHSPATAPTEPAPAGPNLKTGGRLPSLDGWRAVSIILVLGDHTRLVSGFPQEWTGVFSWIFDGNLGVRFFFVISGFLITHLLVREDERRGRISLIDFYLRRALRILPVYYVYLFVALTLSALGGFQQTLASWVANLTFTTNFFERTWTTGHLWSLSVEEQFYLIWPACLVMTGGRRGRTLIYWVLGSPIALAPICRLISHKHLVSGLAQPLFSTYSFLNYFDSLAVGCVAAILWARHRDTISDRLSSKPVVYCGVASLLILVPNAVSRGFLPWFVTIPFVPSLQAAGLGILLLASIALPQHFKLLNWAFIRHIGILSYSLYIWQQMFCGDPRVFGLSSAPWTSFPWWLAAVFLVASVSYFGLEKPLMDLRARFRK